MLVQAILIGLIAMFVTFEWMFGTNLGSRPIITGMLVGLVMGDLKTVLWSSFFEIGRAHV